METKLSKQGLTKEEESELFKALAHKSYKDVGKDFGLDLKYPDYDDKKITSLVYVIARKIRKAPEVWGLSQDVVDVVQAAIDKRNIKSNPGLKSDIAIQEESFKDKLDIMRDTVADIITKKLEKYNTKKGINDVQLRDLKDLLSMAIDKSRLLKGESTENLIKISKIDTENMSPEQALKIVMKARDSLIESRK